MLVVGRTAERLAERAEDHPRIRMFVADVADPDAPAAVVEGPVCPASARVIARRLADVEKRIAALDVVRTRLLEALAQADG